MRGGRSARGQGLRDRRECGVRTGAVRAAGLGHVTPSAAALAAEVAGTGAHQSDRVVTLGQILGDADDEPGLAVRGDADEGDDAARTEHERVVGLIGGDSPRFLRERSLLRWVGRESGVVEYLSDLIWTGEVSLTEATSAEKVPA